MRTLSNEHEYRLPLEVTGSFFKERFEMAQDKSFWRMEHYYFVYESGSDEVLFIAINIFERFFKWFSELLGEDYFSLKFYRSMVKLDLKDNLDDFVFSVNKITSNEIRAIFTNLGQTPSNDLMWIYDSQYAQ